jgi:hypothetical protein
MLCSRCARPCVTAHSVAVSSMPTTTNNGSETWPLVPALTVTQQYTQLEYLFVRKLVQAWPAVGALQAGLRLVTLPLHTHIQLLPPPLAAAALQAAQLPESPIQRVFMLVHPEHGHRLRNSSGRPCLTHQVHHLLLHHGFEALRPRLELKFFLKKRARKEQMAA